MLERPQQPEGPAEVVHDEMHPLDPQRSERFVDELGV